MPHPHSHQGRERHARQQQSQQRQPPACHQTGERLQRLLRPRPLPLRHATRLHEERVERPGGQTGLPERVVQPAEITVRPRHGEPHLDAPLERPDALQAGPLFRGERRLAQQPAPQGIRHGTQTVQRQSLRTGRPHQLRLRQRYQPERRVVGREQLLCQGTRFTDRALHVAIHHGQGPHTHDAGGEQGQHAAAEAQKQPRANRVEPEPHEPIRAMSTGLSTASPCSLKAIGPVTPGNGSRRRPTPAIHSRTACRSAPDASTARPMSIAAS